MDLPYLDAEVEPLEERGGEAGRARRRQERHDLHRRAVDRLLRVNCGECHRERVVERGEQRVLRDVRVRVGVRLRDGRDERVVGQERERGNLVAGAESVHRSPVRLKGRNTHLVHLLGHGGGEEERLPRHVLAVGQAVDDPHELAAEASLEETVRLVEHKRAETGKLALEVRVLEVVDQPSGRRDEDVATLAVQALRLSAHVGSSDDLARQKMVSLYKWGDWTGRAHVLDGVVGRAEQSAGGLLDLDRELASGLRFSYCQLNGHRRLRPHAPT